MTDTIYIHELGITRIAKHPHNPRHRAFADDDMVASVKAAGIIEPLIVAPAETSGRYMLIAGHRRLDAARKAKLPGVPAVVRADLVTEGQQLEAMIIENSHRQDLSPVEEAEGYHQLELLGYKQAAIALAVGRGIKTVRGRLNLLKLAPSTRKKVHAGDLTLEDATAFVEFADDKAATTRLEKATAGELRYAITTERATRKRAQTNAVRVAELLDAGATEVTPKKGEYWYHTLDDSAGLARLDATFSADPADHAGCLGYLIAYPGPNAQVIELCTAPASHRDQLDAAERRRREEVDRLNTERAAERAAAEIASTVRSESVTRLVEGQKLPPVLADLARGLVPNLLPTFGGSPGLTSYFDLMGLEDSQRWSDFYGAANRRLVDDHVEDLNASTDARITQALVAILLATSEMRATSAYGDEGAMRQGYLQFLAAIGHPFCDVDKQLLEQGPKKPQETDDVAVA